MDTRKARAIFGLTTLASLAAVVPAFAQAPTPITVTGYNRDVIAENTTPGSSQGATAGDVNESWGVTGFDGNPADNGLPAGATATSAFTDSLTGGHSAFAFQPGGGSNALIANYDSTNGSVTGTLTFATPGSYQSLAFASAGVNSGSAATSTGLVTYSDGSTQAFTFDASDWDIDRVGGTDIFSPNIGRAVYASYTTPPSLVYDSGGHVNVYETDITTDPTKVIQSVTFSGTYSASPFVAANAGVDVFAVSGVAAAPEPSETTALGLGLLGLAGLMLKVRGGNRAAR